MDAELHTHVQGVCLGGKLLRASKCAPDKRREVHAVIFGIVLQTSCTLRFRASRGALKNGNESVSGEAVYVAVVLFQHRGEPSEQGGYQQTELLDALCTMFSKRLAQLGEPRHVQ